MVAAETKAYKDCVKNILAKKEANHIENMNYLALLRKSQSFQVPNVTSNVRKSSYDAIEESPFEEASEHGNQSSYKNKNEPNVNFIFAAPNILSDFRGRNLKEIGCCMLL